MPNGHEDRLFAKVLTTIARFHGLHGRWPSELLVPRSIALELEELFEGAAQNPFDGPLALVVDDSQYFVARDEKGATCELRFDKGGYFGTPGIREAIAWLFDRNSGE